MACPHCTSVGYLFLYPQQPFTEGSIIDCAVPSGHRLSFACNGKCRQCYEPYLDSKKLQNIMTYKKQESLVQHLTNFHAVGTESETETIPMPPTDFSLTLNDNMVEDTAGIELLGANGSMSVPDEITVGTTVVHNSNSVSMTRFIEWCQKDSTEVAARKLLCLTMYQKTEHASLVGLVNGDSLHLFLCIAIIVVSCSQDNQKHLPSLLRTVWKFLPHLNSSGCQFPLRSANFRVTYGAPGRHLFFGPGMLSNALLLQA